MWRAEDFFGMYCHLPVQSRCLPLCWATAQTSAVSRLTYALHNCIPQEAACSVLESLAQKKPDPTRAEVLKVRERFRSKHYCDRVLAACEAGLAAAAAAKAGGAAVAAAGEGQESDDDAMQE